MKNKGPRLREILSTIVISILLGGQLLFYVFICVAMLWETWFRTPVDQAELDRQWEERDNLPESVKQELRAKYDLLTHDNIPDNEPTGPYAGAYEPIDGELR